MTKHTGPIDLVVYQATNTSPRLNNGTFVALPDGSILLVYQLWYTHRSKDIAPTRLEGKISVDRGRSWGQEFVVKEISGVRVGSPSLLRLASGRILLTHDIGDEQDHRIYWSASDDDGRSWSPSNPLMDQPGYYVSNNDRLIQLDSGRLVNPIALHGRTYEPHGMCTCWYSDDQGETWRKSETDIDLALRGAMEPVVVQQRNGDLLMVIRTQLGKLYRSSSSDRGLHWSPAEPMGLVSTEAPAAIRRMPTTGDLAIIWNRNYEPDDPHMGRRNPLSSAISRDEGETWEHVRDLENSDAYDSAYPAVFFKADEAFVVYYHSDRRTRQTSLKLQVVPIDWLYGR